MLEEFLCNIDCSCKTRLGYCGLTACINPKRWRDATKEEQKSVSDYVNSISVATGENFYDYFENPAKERTQKESEGG